MSKIKIDLGKITKKVLKEQIEFNEMMEQVEYDPEHPERMHPGIEGSLRSGEHILGKSKSIPLTGTEQRYNEKLAGKRFKEIINKVKRYHGVERIDPMMMREMFMIMQQVGQIEAQHKDALERLAIDIVSEEFDIPDEMLEAELVNPGTPISIEPDEGEEEDDTDYGSDFDVPARPKSAERMEELELEVDKRNIINALLQGAAKKGHYIFHMVADELDAIDPRLMGLYGKLMSLADFQYWVIPDQVMDGAVGGSEKIEWRKPESDEEDEEGIEDDGQDVDLEDVGLEDAEEVPVVVAKAWIFPLLVHELIKGTLELSASNWAEGHLDFEEMEEVINRADTTQAEIWGMRLGPGMWEKFLDCIDPEDYDIKQWLFHELTKLPAKQFHEFMKEILSGSEKCSDVIKELKRLHQEDEDESLVDIVTGDEESFEDGLDVMTGDEPASEEPTIEPEEEEVDYESMSNKEIMDLIDAAIDAGDMDRVAELHKYLK
jgi:hypothetical protein